MNALEQGRFTPLFESMQRALKLQGKAKATKDAYSRGVRRSAAYFDRCPDDLSAEELRERRCGTHAQGRYADARGRGSGGNARSRVRLWIVDCEWVGNGEKAPIYLGRYLYRGVLSEKNILDCQDGQVTFRYTENSGAAKTRTLAGAGFLWLLLQHVLPKGFRRTRDYGFLHGNCKRLIRQLHLLLRVCLPRPKEKPSLCCRLCGGAVTLTVIPYPRNRKPPDGPGAILLEMPM